jgi:hypothetical protein
MPSFGAFCLNRNRFLSAEVASKEDNFSKKKSTYIQITSLSEESIENT